MEYQWKIHSSTEQVREDLLPPGSIEHEFQKNMNKQVIALFADESLPRNKALAILNSTHSIYQQMLRSMYAYQKSAKLRSRLHLGTSYVMAK